MELRSQSLYPMNMLYLYDDNIKLLLLGIKKVPQNQSNKTH